MEVKIDYNPVGIITLDLKGFKEELKKDLNLRDSYYRNMLIKQHREIDPGDLAEYVFMNTDWTNILLIGKEVRQDSTELVVYKCNVKGFVTYDPDSVDVQGGSFILKDVFVDEDIYYLTYNASNPRVDKHIEFMLSQHLINYFKFEWKKVFRI